jgi:hypothetical protein
MNMNESINEELNKSIVWQNAECIYCKRRYPQTLLNIEGYIHHNTVIRCIDQKKCKKIARRLK